jgi:O-antigen/teichoic acid export membrane protein
VYILYNIGQMGMAESLFYFLPTAPERAGRYIVNSLIILGGIGVVCAVGLGFASEYIARWLSNAGLEGYVPLAGLHLLFMLSGCVLEIILISRRRYQAATASYVISDLLRAAFLLAPVLLFHSLQAVLIGGGIFALLRTLVVMFYVRHDFKSGLRPDWKLLKEQLAYTLPFSLSVLVGVATTNYHQVAVSSFFDAATFAVYSIGCLQIPLIDFMATPASNVMMVRMAEEIRDGRNSELLWIWYDTTRKLALVFFAMVGLLIVTARPLIEFLFTSRYAASIPIFMVWSLSILFAAFQTDGVMRVFAQTRYLVVINIARLIAIVAVMGWFLRTFNLVGAVLVTLMGMFVAKGMALIRMRTLMNVSFTELLPWKNLAAILMAAMIAALPVSLLNARIHLAPIYLLPMSGMVYLLSYISLVFIFRILSESERQTIVAFAARYVAIPARKPE